MTIVSIFRVRAEGYGEEVAAEHVFLFQLFYCTARQKLSMYFVVILYKVVGSITFLGV